ncbi:hypothetical protein ZOD2009_22327 [Haladaptatus paucihalophilus DX253]|uniref:DUF7993 domain-containing protein n=1 Tax=Haladaptatus paucihalophilus DX253 TaxID=797209 RepID=E7R071_HALPU|nr:hypothetical protein [Haladaptatus paucihalophilus]EFW89965.1 hypothetical protein ZOD2009_22327 [Haladaptatus paucihalophilus DX253]SHK59547.1 hypothetical protein SAMN05444342_1795 [Haladaptatus paucihalophilus DX253]
MVEDRITDGVRIAQLLSSEFDGREDPPLDSVAVVNADPDVEPSEDGALAYELERNGDPAAKVFVHPDRVRIELTDEIEAVERKAAESGIRVRPKAVRPPRVLVFVESGAEVKRAVDAVIESL